MKGTVKFFSNTKGWGFITCEDGKMSLCITQAF